MPSCNKICNAGGKRIFFPGARFFLFCMIFLFEVNYSALAQWKGAVENKNNFCCSSLGGVREFLYYPENNIKIQNGPSVSLGDNLNYNILDNRSMLIGGRFYSDSVPTFIYAAPYGGSALGTVLSVAMTKRGVGGEQPALAPFGTDGPGGLSGYPEMDAAATWVFAHGTKPWVTVGEDFINSDSRRRVVSFDSRHAFFSPALPTQEVKLLRVGMHVVTNILGPRHSGARRERYWKPFNGFSAEVTAISASGDSIEVGGWRVLGDGDVNPSQIPLSSGHLDLHTWPSIIHPAIFIGTYTHAIDNNSMCFLEKRENFPSGDANAPEGNQFGTPVNDCEIEEADLSSALPDYEGRAKGILVTYNGPNKPSLDSYDFMAAGLTPNGFVAWNGSNANNFLSDGFYAHGNSGVFSKFDNVSGNVIGEKGDTRELAEFIGASAVNSDKNGIGDKLSLVAFEELLSDQNDMRKSLASNVAIHWGYLVNGTDTNVANLTGGDKVNMERRNGDLIFNSDGRGGVDIVGGNASGGVLFDAAGNLILQRPQAALEFAQEGSLSALRIESNGKNTIRFISNTGDNVISLSDDFVGKIFRASQYFQEKLTTPASSTAACNEGQFSDDQNYHYVCVQKNRWKRVKLSSW
ncbi:hypothetical protein [Acetobacter nitrogenifigens]|nr:hypothetical protein [Acetobacter nitrogenifigens]